MKISWPGGEVTGALKRYMWCQSIALLDPSPDTDWLLSSDKPLSLSPADGAWSLLGDFDLDQAAKRDLAEFGSWVKAVDLGGRGSLPLE